MTGFGHSHKHEVHEHHHDQSGAHGGLGGGIPGTHYRNPDIQTADEVQRHHQQHLQDAGNARPGDVVTTTTHVPKPSVGDKVSGAMDKMVGKMTHNPEKIAEGNVKQGKPANDGMPINSAHNPAIGGPQNNVGGTHGAAGMGAAGLAPTRGPY